MKLFEALRVQPGESISFSGSGGKTTALITLAGELDCPVIATTTTHLSREQLGFADQVISSAEISNLEEFVESISSGTTLLIGEKVKNNRVSGPPLEQLEEIYQHTSSRGIALLVEVDGARQRALKAPAEYEPVIPPFIDQAVVVAGLTGLDKQLSPKYVHRVERFAQLSQLSEGDTITQDAVSRVLSDDIGGRKGIPAGARSICLINQADDENLQAKGKRLSTLLTDSYDAVIVASLLHDREPRINTSPVERVNEGYIICGVFEPVAGIILAAGGSERLGRPKQLLQWKGSSLIRHTVERVMHFGLDQVVVVVGAYADQVRQDITDLEVEIIGNPDWESGQSTSVKLGISAIPRNYGSAIFFLVDQPYVSQTLIRSMIARHAETLAPIIAPIVDGQRGNPVLFDRNTFNDFQKLRGDTGGRELFSRYKVAWIDWHDDGILLDIDTDEDYQRLIQDTRRID